MNSVVIQQVDDSPGVPDSRRIQKWALDVLQNRIQNCEIVIRIVGTAESATLNRAYRGKTGPTNVLSFAYDPIPNLPAIVLGDVVICAPVVAEEAAAQQKTSEAHWAHMVVHGLLHLLGYDHIHENDAVQMEALELEILTEMGYPDPYQEVVSRWLEKA